MSDQINDGGPAFPFAAEYGHPAACGGMSLRDWFAGQALTGLIASNQWHIGSVHGSGANTIADHAYEMAAAMLAARKGGDA